MQYEYLGGLAEGLQQADGWLGAMGPVLEKLGWVAQGSYGLMMHVMPLLVILMFLLMLRWNRRIAEIARRQEMHTRTLVKILNLQPGSEYQQYKVKLEEMAEQKGPTIPLVQTIKKS